LSHIVLTLPKCEYGAIAFTKEPALRRYSILHEELMIVEEATAATNHLEDLERLYTFRHPIQVRSFLNEYAFLIPLLDAAHDAAIRYFAPVSLALEVIADPDSTDDQQLVLFVVLQDTPAEAFANLQRFDDEWWLDAIDEAQGRLCISLELL